MTTMIFPLPRPHQALRLLRRCIPQHTLLGILHQAMCTHSLHLTQVCMYVCVSLKMLFFKYCFCPCFFALSLPSFLTSCKVRKLVSRVWLPLARCVISGSFCVVINLFFIFAVLPGTDGGAPAPAGSATVFTSMYHQHHHSTTTTTTTVQFAPPPPPPSPHVYPSTGKQRKTK